MTRERRRAVAVLATVAVIAGAAGAINALGSPLMADRGQQLWRLYAMNAFGGLITVLVGLVAFAAVGVRSKAVAALAGLMFLGVAGLTLIGLGQTYNLFGGRASTVSLWLTLGLGFTALAVSPEVEGGAPATSEG